MCRVAGVITMNLSDWLDDQEFHTCSCGETHILVEFVRKSNGGKPQYIPSPVELVDSKDCMECSMKRRTKVRAWEENH